MPRATYNVCVPNEPPETGVRCVDTVDRLERGLAAARELAERRGPRSIAYVEKDGTNEVWSVQFLPDPPKYQGLDANYNPILEHGPRFRVVHDATEQVLETDPDTEEIVRTYVEGEVQVWDEEAPNDD